MSIDLDNVRFFVIKNQDTLQLNGVLHDSVNFEILDDFISNVSSFDFSKLQYVSWHGLNNLHSYVAKHESKYTFINIPFQIYQYVKLIKGFCENIDVDSFQTQFLAAGNGDNKVELKYIDKSNIKLICDDKNVFPELEGARLLGYNFNVLPVNEHFNNYINIILREQTQEKFDYFLMNYMFFSRTTLSLARDLLESVCLSLSHLLKEVTSRMGNMYTSLSEVKVNLDQKSFGELKSLVDQIDDHCNKESEFLENVTGEYQKIIVKYQNKVLKGEKLSDTDYISSLTEICELIKKCEHVTQRMEQIGTTFGNIIFGNNDISVIKQNFAKITEDMVGEQELAHIRDRLNIMNPMSEDSWEDTMEDIAEEIELLESMYNQCSPILQGFDLTRQVLEHRLNEHRLIEEFIKASQGNVDWVQLREDLGKKATSELVTEQEKFSFAYFLPTDHDKFTSAKNFHSPGDCLFF